VALTLASTSRALSDPVTTQAQGTTVTAPPHCEVAVVSPVSGHAECVKPRGAPVAPPKRPQKKRAVKPPAT
jgi:hypothetical protein